MALISAILNKVSCGLSELLGTGQKFCKFDFRTPTTIVLLQKGYKIPPETDFNLEYVQQLAQKGIAIIIDGVKGFTNNTPENTFGTYEATGEQYLTLKSPYMWQFTFNSGLYYYKALAKLESNGQYDILLFDTKGDMIGAMDNQGNLRGLDLGLFSVGAYIIGNDNTETVTVQVNRANFDNQVAWITNENLDFTASQDLDGYNDTTITLVAPADAATTVLFSINATSNNKLVALQGLAKTDLLYQVDGATVAITTLTALPVAGNYSLTVPAVDTGDVITLQLFDSTLNANIILLEGAMYKSNVATTTVL